MSVTPLNAGDEMHAGRVVHRRNVQRDALPAGYRASIHSAKVIAIEEASHVRIWDEIEPDPLP